MNQTEEELVGMVDTMIGCACNLNQQNWEMLVKTREEFKIAVHNKLYKILI